MHRQKMVQIKMFCAARIRVRQMDRSIWNSYHNVPSKVDGKFCQVVVRSFALQVKTSAFQ